MTRAWENETLRPQRMSKQAKKVNWKKVCIEQLKERMKHEMRKSRNGGKIKKWQPEESVMTRLLYQKLSNKKPKEKHAAVIEIRTVATYLETPD